ncbi:hypothetical protein DFY03_24720, partial [Escherichia coli]|nr:hypothetical protein [Escherichia coli]
MKKESCKTLKRSLLSVLVTSALCTPHAMAAFTPSVPNGETVTGEVVENGTQTIQAGGEADHTTINRNGVQHVYGTASNTTINNGQQTVYKGSTASDTTINSGSQYVYGTASDTIINDDGKQFVFKGSTANDTTINNGGWQIVESEGTASVTAINNGGYQRVYGIALDTTINDGGWQLVYGGGTASDTIINDGGLMMTVGTDSDTTVQAGGRYILGKYTFTPDDPDADWTYADTATAQNLTVTGGTAQVSAGTLTGAVVSAAGQLMLTPENDGDKKT